MRTTLPRPPIRLVPPITTAAITWSSKPIRMFGSADCIRAVSITAATAASVPHSAKTITLIGRGSMPERRTASSFVPMATMYRPNTVYDSTSCPAMTTASAMRNGFEKGSETPKIDAAAMEAMGEPMYCVLEPVTRYVAPRAISSMPSVTMKEGSRHAIVREPLISPQQRPAPMHAAIATGAGRP